MDLHTLFKENYKGTSDSLEHSLEVLKNAGYSQIDAVKVLVQVLGLEKMLDIASNLSQIWSSSGFE